MGHNLRHSKLEKMKLEYHVQIFGSQFLDSAQSLSLGIHKHLSPTLFYQHQTHGLTLQMHQKCSRDSYFLSNSGAIPMNMKYNETIKYKKMNCSFIQLTNGVKKSIPASPSNSTIMKNPSTL